MQKGGASPFLWGCARWPVCRWILT
ncbi:MAG: hypothetical protein HRT46_09015 [Deltaproteobacteria bacterium]|nr:hypothetical protein [Deltaproteobacteria bacterium]